MSHVDALNRVFTHSVESLRVGVLMTCLCHHAFLISSVCALYTNCCVCLQNICSTVVVSSCGIDPRPRYVTGVCVGDKGDARRSATCGCRGPESERTRQRDDQDELESGTVGVGRGASELVDNFGG